MSTLNELMDLDPLSLTKTDLDEIIAYYRKRRAEQASGVKRPKKEAGEVDLSSVMANLIGEKKETPVVKRRI